MELNKENTLSSYNLADLFEIIVDTVPDNLALVADEKHLSYAELDERCNRLAHYLLGQGVKAGQHIGILAFNRAEWIETMLAAFKIRAVPININFRYVEDELAYILDNADVAALVHERDFVPRLLNITQRLPQCTEFLVLEDSSSYDSGPLNAKPYEEALTQSPATRGFEQRSSDDIYMLYTGGTTGLPKGTLWRHEDIFFGAMQGGNPGGESIESPDVLAETMKNGLPLSSVCPAPMMHGGGMWTSMINFFSGGTFILYCERTFDAEKILALVEREKALSLLVVGDAMARPIADAIEANNFDLSSFMLFSSGGAILSKPVKNKLKALLPNAIILDGFGASETGHNGTVLDMEDEAAGPRFTLEPDSKILDDELKPIAPGSDTVGLLARCGHIPLGYYKDEKKTAATFKVDSNGVRWVIPGDHAQVLADGTVQLLGRGSGCINSGGEKIFPEEVEAVLKGHPAVFDVVVVGVPDERFTNKVAAIVKTREHQDVTLESLIDYCATRLARYKAPRALLIVDEIKRTPAGKPDYKAAKDLALDKLT